MQEPHCSDICVGCLGLGVCFGQRGFVPVQLPTCIESIYLHLLFGPRNIGKPLCDFCSISLILSCPCPLSFFKLLLQESLVLVFVEVFWFVNKASNFGWQLSPLERGHKWVDVAFSTTCHRVCFGATLSRPSITGDLLQITERWVPKCSCLVAPLGQGSPFYLE